MSRNPQDEERLARRAGVRSDVADALATAEVMDTPAAWVRFVLAWHLPDADPDEVREAVRRVVDRSVAYPDLAALRWLILRQAMAEAGWGGGPELPEPADGSMLGGMVALRRAGEWWHAWAWEDALYAIDLPGDAAARVREHLADAMRVMAEPADGTAMRRRHAVEHVRRALVALGPPPRANPQDEERLARRSAEHGLVDQDVAVLDRGFASLPWVRPNMDMLAACIGDLLADHDPPAASWHALGPPGPEATGLVLAIVADGQALLMQAWFHQAQPTEVDAIRTATGGALDSTLRLREWRAALARFVSHTAVAGVFLRPRGQRPGPYVQVRQPTWGKTASAIVPVAVAEAWATHVFSQPPRPLPNPQDEERLARRHGHGADGPELALEVLSYGHSPRYAGSLRVSAGGLSGAYVSGGQLDIPPSSMERDCVVSSVHPDHEVVVTTTAGQVVLSGRRIAVGRTVNTRGIVLHVVGLAPPTPEPTAWILAGTMQRAGGIYFVDDINGRTIDDATEFPGQSLLLRSMQVTRLARLS